MGRVDLLQCTLQIIVAPYSKGIGARTLTGGFDDCGFRGIDLVGIRRHFGDGDGVAEDGRYINEVLSTVITNKASLACKALRRCCVVWPDTPHSGRPTNVSQSVSISDISCG